MFRKDKISSNQISSVLQDYSKETPELIYYSIRVIDSIDSIHLDFLFLVPLNKVKGGQASLDRFVEEGILDKLYKIGGNVLKGRDYNFGDVENIYFNTNFFAKK